ncbi:hypothetical protein VMCG_04311 [Cytospora schulzeri]|uniref:Uncharacterized protein n=1 Tax=Cytospora schulzeri TaxID=448051 RepID=A0A423WST7_9PEZI|nr:hypothetical protein VMCG_04311 [Valsa malicola]
MGPEGNELTHDDIWDDSALVSSWNEALDEYKKYHSIHASGGKLEDLPEFQQDGNAKPEPASPPDAPTSEQEQEQAPSNHQPQHVERHYSKVEETATDSAGVTGDGVANGASNAGVAQGLSGGGPMPPPQALLGSMQDEGLKRLLMSWYYAGYYTGLYEGQQRKS